MFTLHQAHMELSEAFWTHHTANALNDEIEIWILVNCTRDSAFLFWGNIWHWCIGTNAGFNYWSQ